MTLCKVCNRLDLKDFVDWDGMAEQISHHRSFSALESSAQTCSLCALIHSSLLPKLDPEDPNNRAHPVYLRAVLLVDDDIDTEAGGIFWIKASCHAAYVYLNLHPSPTSPVPIPATTIIGRPITPPEQNLALLRTWLAHCTTAHKTCSVPGALPTRVINVGLPTDDFVRLETTVPGTVTPYMTLSHCWGPTPHLVIRTLTSNIDAHTARIPLTALTNTFRDAVAVTRAVGIPYLWIDSLCIVQDSADDWARESAKMGFIYANSHLTIAAAASADSTGGCFHHSNMPKAKRAWPVIKCTTDEGTGLVAVTPRLGDFDTLKDAPLHVRAWVKQERILSPRTVHFDRDQMLWECREERICESGVPEGAFSVQRKLWDGRLHFESGAPAAKGRKFWWDWYDLVEGYTGHGLTKGEDKLPALSGLADMLGRATGGGYVAGLWRDHLPWGLLWRKKGRWLRPAEGYRAPSWSWAGWDGIVQWVGEADLEGFALKVISDVEGVEAVSVPEGIDPRGRLKGGHLKLTGRAKEVDPRTDPKSESYEKLAGVMESLNLTVDFVKSDGAKIGLAFFDKDYEPGSGPLYCLRLARIEGSQGAKLPSLFFGLLLESTGKENEFRRVGMAEHREVGVGRYGGPVETQPDFFADASKREIMIV
ncbi:hypothetical protein OQA88_6943 [Cercophora sp. LCS_1]